jgi:hypothetical protein
MILLVQGTPTTFPLHLILPSAAPGFDYHRRFAHGRLKEVNVKGSGLGGQTKVQLLVGKNTNANAIYCWGLSLATLKEPCSGSVPCES